MLTIEEKITSVCVCDAGTPLETQEKVLQLICCANNEINSIFSVPLAIDNVYLSMYLIPDCLD